MTSSPKAGADRAHPNPSTGPRSAAGKARSSMNALKSGIYSKSLTIPGGDPAQLDTLLEEYSQRFRPTLPEQRDLVDIMVRSTWTLRRLGTAEAQVLTYQMERTYKLNPNAPLGHAFHECDRTLDRLQRLINSTQRNYRDALHEIERLQASPTPMPAPDPKPAPQPAETEPVTSSGQFVSSTSAPPPPPAKTAPEKPLPYHRPGGSCRFLPADPVARRKYKQCPWCFPDQEISPDAQE